MRGRRESKIGPAPIVRAHLRTLIDATSGKPRWRDYAEQFAVPAATGLVTWWFRARTSGVTGAAILTVAGLFAAFLFGLTIQLFDRAATWADDQPDPGPVTSRYAALLGELSANAAYASLVAAFTAVASLAVTISSKGWQERLLTATTVTLLVHLGLTLLMVTRRVFLLTASRLRDARTGAHRENL